MNRLPVLRWGPEPPHDKRFSQGRGLYMNDRRVGEYMWHEEDGSLHAVDEVLTALARASIIKYEGLK